MLRTIKISERTAKQLDFLKKTGAIKDDGEVIMEVAVDIYSEDVYNDEYRKLSYKERDEEKAKVAQVARDENDQFWDWFDRGMKYLDEKESKLGG